MVARLLDLGAVAGAPLGLVGRAACEPAGPYPLLTGCVLGGLGCRWFTCWGPQREEGGRREDEEGRRAMVAVTGLASLWARRCGALSGIAHNALQEREVGPWSTHSREGLLVVTSWHFPLWPSEKDLGLGQERGAPSRP